MAKHALTARSFRALAEWAHGTRNAHTWFIVSPDGSVRTEMSALEPLVGEDEFAIPFLVTDQVGDRRSIERFEIQGRGLPATVDLLRHFELPADSVFVTESAVEKFLVPYYAARDGAEAAARVQRVFNGQEKPPVYAEVQVEVFALVHLPKSDYVPSPDAPSDLALVYVVQDEVRAETLPAYLARTTR